MKRRWTGAVVSLTLAIAVVAVATAVAGAPAKKFRGQLSGYQVVPAVSTLGAGKVVIKILHTGDLSYRLDYSTLQGSVTQAHVHFGQAGVAGGISVFLCTNLGNGPVGTPACPAAPGSVSGTIAAAGVIGPTAQGIAAGDLVGLERAMRKRVTYADVHSTTYPSGEIRGLLRPFG